MSLSWPNPFASYLLVGLSRQHIAMMQMSSVRQRILQKQHMTVAETQTEPNWKAVLAELQKILSVSFKTKPRELRVILASDFVRYLMLPAHHSVMSASDKVDLAHAMYKEIYGGLADGWLIQCDDAAPNQISLAVAIDKGLIEDLHTLALKHDMQLVSVQPYLMTVFNRAKSQFTAGQRYFAVVESNRLLLASINDGHWLQVRNFPLESEWAVQLQHVVQREAMSNDGNNNRTLMVYAPSEKATDLPNIVGWTVRRIGIQNQPKLGQTDSRYFSMLETV